MTSYRLTWYDDGNREPDHADAANNDGRDPGLRRYCAQDPALASALGVGDSRLAQAQIRAAVHDLRPDVAGRIEFDSEASCFFAYTATQADMEALAEIVAHAVAQAQGPGTEEGQSVPQPVVRYITMAPSPYDGGAQAGTDGPRPARDGDAAADLRASADVTLAPRARAAVGTGVAVELPEGTCGLVVPRSGLAARHGLSIVNAPGLIDSNYRGEIQVLLVNLGDEPVTLERGERIAQLLVVPVATTTWVRVDSLSDTNRGDGRFGSSGRH